MQLLTRLSKREGQASRIRTRLMAVVLTLVMVFGLLPSGLITLTTYAADGINVTVSYSNGAESGYGFAPQSIYVSADIAEAYGYTDNVSDGVSMVDVVVAMHKLVYGDDLTNQFTMSGVSVTKMMGVDGYNKIFSVNSTIGNDTVPDMRIADGDVIELFEMQDSWGMDAYTWFEQEGIEVTQLSAMTGEVINLSLNGINSFGWGSWAMPEAPIEDASIVTMQYEDHGSYATAYMDEDLNITTDANGDFTVTFDEPGTYYLTAIGTDAYDYPITLPWLAITVTYDEFTQAKVDAKNQLDSYKDASDYRAEQQNELANAIAEGKSAIDDAADVDAINSAVANAKAAIDAIKTDAQLTEEEEANLNQTKTEAKAALDAYKNSSDYRDEQKTELENAIAEGKAAIDAATDVTGINTAVSNAKAVMDAIKTDAQLTAEENAAAPVEYTEALNDVLTYIRSQVQSPQVNSIGGEWAVLALLRGGINDETWNETYLDNLEQYVKTNAASIDTSTGKVILHNTKTTENERVVIALTALGIDAASFRGYDLVSALLDKDESGNYKLASQGINSVIYALIALDCGDYLQNSEGQALREWCIDYLLEHQKANGGWSFITVTTSGSAAPDVTGMVLQALAPYYKDSSSYQYTQVKTAVESAVQALWDMQASDGSFSDSDEGKTSESTAQVVAALTALGYDGTDDGSFLKSAVTNLLTYQDSATGGFKHSAGGSVNQMASEQAAYALVAYDRFVKKQNTLYDMSDISSSTDPGTADTDKKFVTIYDENGTGIMLTYQEGVLQAGTKLWVDIVNSGSDYEKADSALKGKGEKFKLFDIYLLKNNVEVQPDGKITISIPVPEDYNGTNCKVYHINDDGTVTDMNAVLKDGYLVFETDHLSLYAVLQTAAASTGTTTTATTTNTTTSTATGTKTGDNSNTPLWFAFSVISMMALAVMLKRRKQQNM